MSTTIIDTHGQRGISQEVRRFLIVAARNLPILRPCFYHLPSRSGNFEEMQRAWRTILMARNPGESYEMATERIEREATEYKKFLAHPKAIGKLVLKTKRLDLDETTTDSFKDQCHVHDPAEGQEDPDEGKASFSYRYARSRTKVLEFFLHDENDVPLFPIARTYSNWVGNKTFDLGSDRVFYLNMTDDGPGYVSVQAGFSKKEAPVMDVWSNPQMKQKPSLAARFGAAMKRIGMLNVFVPFSRKLACFLACECALAVLLFCSIANFFASSNTTIELPTTPLTPVIAVMNSTAQVKVLAPAAIWRLSTKVLTFSADGSNSNKLTSVGTTHDIPHNRLIRIRKLNVLIDNSSCKESMGHCHDLLATVQENVEARLNDLRLPVSVHETDSDTDAMNLVVSYEPTDLKRGKLLLTLYDHNSSLLETDTATGVTGESAPAFGTNHWDETTLQLLLGVTTTQLDLETTTAPSKTEVTMTE
jgi:hypothetical protein